MGLRPASFVNYKKGCTRPAAANDKVYQLLAHGRWFSPGALASSTTKTGRHDIAEILLKVALNTKIQFNSILPKAKCRRIYDRYVSSEEPKTSLHKGHDAASEPNANHYQLNIPDPTLHTLSDLSNYAWKNTTLLETSNIRSFHKSVKYHFKCNLYFSIWRYHGDMKFYNTF